ncbi:hypothetical protein [Planctomicrobium sp. SH527]|uniref:hypothetical protein n=1 Tax=Planctomicrobium sp. SH527 TaxID=3448123 RepID=UPI003F5BB65D
MPSQPSPLPAAQGAYLVDAGNSFSLPILNDGMLCGKTSQPESDILGFRLWKSVRLRN